MRYSQIQKQRIVCLTKIDGPVVIDSTSIILNFNYNSQGLGSSFEGVHIDNLRKSSDPFFRFELFSYKRDRSYLVEQYDYYKEMNLDIQTSLRTCKADESWLFLRDPFLSLDTFIYPSNDTTKEKIEKRTYRVSDLKTNNKYYEIEYNAEKHLSYEDYMPPLTKKDIYSDITDSLSIQHPLTEGVFKPRVFSSFDISKMYFEIQICTLISFIPNPSIILEFNGLIKPDNIYPEPDILKSHQIIYKDKKKIDEISRNGFQCTMRFPQNETLQQVRIYIISALITLFFTILCKVIWDIVRKKYKERKRYNKVKLSLLQKGHERFYASLCKQRYLANVCICFPLSLLILTIAPSNIIVSPFFVIGIIGLYIPYFSYLNSMTKGIINGLHLETECKRVINIPMYIYLVIVVLNFIYLFYHIYKAKTNVSLTLQTLNYGYLFVSILAIILLFLCYRYYIEHKFDVFIQNLKNISLKQQKQKVFTSIGLLCLAVFVLCIILSRSSCSFILFSSICLLLYMIYLYWIVVCKR